jgi:hypothetical protein
VLYPLSLKYCTCQNTGDIAIQKEEKGPSKIEERCSESGERVWTLDDSPKV